MKFNHKKFFDGVRDFLNKHDIDLTQSRVNAFERLLSNFEADAKWSDVRFIAYALATICIETAWTFEPIQEYGTYSYFERRYGPQTKVGKHLGNDAVGEGAKYSGKGYVQLTGESNYERLEEALRKQYPDLIKRFEARTGQHFDLTDYVNQAKDPELAFAIMTIGMFEGIYTGKRFRDFINSKGTDYKNARKIINGLDRAAEIAGYAKELEKILKNSAGASANEEPAKDSQSTVKVGTKVESPSAVEGISEIPFEPAKNEPSPNTILEQTENLPGKIQETVTETIETGNKQIEKTVSEVTNTFEPKNIPAFIPRFGKQWLLGLIPGAGFLSTIGAYIAQLPQWMIILLAVLAAIALWKFFELVIKHRETIGSFLINCYRATSDPEMHNLIPTSAEPFIGARKEMLEQVFKTE